MWNFTCRKKQNRYVSYSDFDSRITDRMRECIGFLNELKLERNLKFGEYKSCIAWTNGDDSIWFNIQYFAKWCNAKTKAGFYLKALPVVAHEMAHSNDNRETDYHGYGFDKNHVEILENLMKKASSIVDKEAN